MRSTVLCTALLACAFSPVADAAPATMFPLGAYIGQPDNSSAASQATFAAEYTSFAKLIGATPQFLD